MKQGKWLLLLAITFFLALTFRLPGSDHHFSLNLEPYPDGLFYALPAWNWARGEGFTFSYQGISPLKPSVLPLYSLFLSIGYLLHQFPGSFYWINVILGLISLVALSLTLKTLKLPLIAQIFGLLTYLAHGLIFWLVAVPMAENLGLTLMNLGILGATKVHEKPRPVWLILTIIASAGLVFTKYTFALPAVLLMLEVIWILVRHRAWLWLVIISGLGLTGLIIFSLYQINIGFNPLNVVRNLGQESTVVAQTTFYSLNYLIQNTWAYFQILGGKTTLFLWLKTPFTHGLLVLAAALGFVLSVMRDKHRSWSLSLIGSFLAQFPVLLIFYVIDARYIILSVPFIALGVGLLTAQPLSKQWLIRGGILGALLVFLFSQVPLWRSLVAANWLNRSEAWQYRAIQVIDQTLPNHSFVITALPPHLFELYSQQNFQILPLSPEQEFLEKDQVVWPSLTHPHDLLADYHQKLQTGSSVYASKSYLTAEAAFSQSWQELETNFDLKLVTEGCVQTCNIYQLMPKTN